jgi:hypothetical protein
MATTPTKDPFFAGEMVMVSVGWTGSSVQAAKIVSTTETEATVKWDRGDSDVVLLSQITKLENVGRRARRNVFRFQESEHSSPEKSAKGRGRTPRKGNSKSNSPAVKVKTENKDPLKRGKAAASPIATTSNQANKKVKVKLEPATSFVTAGRGRKEKFRTAKKNLTFEDNHLDTLPPSRSAQNGRLSPFLGALPPLGAGSNESYDFPDYDSSVSDTTVEYITPRGQATKPQQPGGCLPSDSEDSEEEVEEYDWKKSLWDRLKLAGWSNKSAKRPGEPKAVWWYIRPNRNVNTGEVGLDIFRTKESVIAWLKAKEKRKTRNRSFSSALNHELKIEDCADEGEDEDEDDGKEFAFKPINKSKSAAVTTTSSTANTTSRAAARKREEEMKNIFDDSSDESSRASSRASSRVSSRVAAVKAQTSKISALSSIKTSSTTTKAAPEVIDLCGSSSEDDELSVIDLT